MYKTKPITDGLIVNENAIVYEDDNCLIMYDFWGEYGDFSFLIHNKGDDDLYLHLEECFYVVNGIAYDYYQNRTYTSSNTRTASKTGSYSIGGGSSTTSASGYANAWAIGSSVYGSGFGSSSTYKNGYIVGTSNTVVNTSSSSVSTSEKKTICIPPKTSKSITEFNIKSSIFRSCDLLLYPSKKDKNSLTFTREDSPYTFGNILSISIGSSEEHTTIKNEFYVSSISNYAQDDITNREPQSDCGEKLYGLSKIVFTQSGPDQFFIEYKLDPNNNTGRKH